MIATEITIADCFIGIWHWLNFDIVLVCWRFRFFVGVCRLIHRKLKWQRAACIAAEYFVQKIPMRANTQDVVWKIHEIQMILDIIRWSAVLWERM